MDEQNIDHNPVIDAGRTRDISDYSFAEIAMAESRRPVVESILVKKPRTKSDVEKAARLVGITGRQLYSIMNAYNKDPCVGSLIGAKRGRKRGSRTLDAAVEEIISDAIETKYKSLEKKSVQYVARHVDAICNRKGLPKPALNTIKARIAAIDDRDSIMPEKATKSPEIAIHQ